MKNVSGMTRGQGHEICNQVDNACKELGINAEEFLSNLIREKFFFKKTKEILSTHSNSETFKISDIFSHRAETGDKRLWLSDNFTNWVLKPNSEKLINIQNIGKLNLFTLPESMSDTKIQQAVGNPGYMTPEDFFLVMYLLIFEIEKGKEYLDFSLEKFKCYIFHIVVNGKLVAVYVFWNNDVWYFHAYDFDDGDDWLGGRVFVRLATV